MQRFNAATTEEETNIQEIHDRELAEYEEREATKKARKNWKRAKNPASTG